MSGAPLPSPNALQRRDLGRLMFAHVQAVQVADDELERRQPDEQAQGHADHDAAMGTLRSRRMYQAPMPPTMKAVVRYAAATIWVNR